VEVVFSVDGQIVVDNQRNLLDIDSSGPDVGGDEDSAVNTRARTEEGEKVSSHRTQKAYKDRERETYEAPLRNSAMMVSRSF